MNRQSAPEFGECGEDLSQKYSPVIAAFQLLGGRARLAPVRVEQGEGDRRVGAGIEKCEACEEESGRVHGENKVGHGS